MERWEELPLRAVCSIDKRQGMHANLPYVGLEHIESGTSRFVGSLNALCVKSTTFRFSNSHVLYGRLRPYLNKVLLPDFDGHCSTEIFPLLPSARLDRNFLCYWLSSSAIVAAIDATCTGARMPRANMEKVLDFVLPLPPLAEQRRIVAILDEALEAIATAKANTEKKLGNARELFEQAVESVFQEGATHWRSFPLEAIGKTQTGSTPKSAEPDQYGDALPFIKPGDFKPDGTLEYGNDGLSELGASRVRVVPANSALMVCIGATIGKAGFCDRPIATNQQVNAWTPSGEVLARFVWYQMTTRQFQRRVRENAGQATLPIINKSKWSSLAVVVPPSLEDQVNILKRLDALGAHVDALCKVLMRKLAVLDELKKSLLHEAFTGQLTTKSIDKQLETAA